MLTQISENRHLMPVFEDLMDADGSEIYIKSVESYLKSPGTVNFYTIGQAAAEKNEIAIGYIRCRGEHCRNVTLNPLKPNMVDFTFEDKVIVVAEN
jgi:ion channel POLLUX/CASTOR